MYRNVKNADNLLFLNHIAVMLILFEKDNKLFLNFFYKIVCLSKISLLILKPEENLEYGKVQFSQTGTNPG